MLVNPRTQGLDNYSLRLDANGVRAQISVCDLDLPPLELFLDSALGLLIIEHLGLSRQIVRFSYLTIKD
jgi:hypothetical protein